MFSKFRREVFNSSCGLSICCAVTANGNVGNDYGDGNENDVDNYWTDNLVSFRFERFN